MKNATTETKKRTSAGRPQQPKCSHCNKALYKRMDAGPVKVEDTYGWCRNPSCDHYNQDQSGASRFKPLEGKLKAARAAVDSALDGAAPAGKRSNTILPPAGASTKSKTIPPAAKVIPIETGKKSAPAAAPAEEPKAKAKTKTIPPASSEKHGKPVLNVAPTAAKAGTEGAKRAGESIPPPGEHPAVTKGRRRIKKLLAAAGKDMVNAIGVALAIVKQETSDDKAVNGLIEALKLGEHGFKPVSSEKRKKAKRSAAQAEA